jgi:hypothetical protein
MENRISEVSHKGKTIIYGDYSGLTFDDFIKTIEQHEEASLKASDKNILHLLNFTDCKMSGDARDRAKAMLKKLNDKGYSVKSACFGIGSLQRLIASAVQKDIYFAKTREDAMDWLVKE